MNVTAFYRFTDLPDPSTFRDALYRFCSEQNLLGTVLVAHEGVNGTLAGRRRDLEAALRFVTETLALDEPLDARWTVAAEAPFHRLRVKVKKEIVTLGRPDIRPDRQTGIHLEPAAWNELVKQPDTLLIDTRNRYEVELGTFSGAIDPDTDSFRDFPAFVAALPEADKAKPVAMFCTGGIRCEKASALLLEMGFNDVYQLQGGILRYLEETPRDDSRWSGECFVFDKRVAVDRDRAEGGYVQCHACRRPLGSDDLASRDYVEGVSCPRCIGSADDERATRLNERRRQVALARERGEQHIGPRSEPETRADND